jgi:two-component sensor histidine kinase
LFRAAAVHSGAVNLKLDLAPIRLAIDQSIPCGLLVNELVSNSLKHAFPEGRSGDVYVELQPAEEEGLLRLRVSDTGVGLPSGFDLKRSTSLGLRLVSDLSRQMGGKLEVGTGPGAVFTVKFQASGKGDGENKGK